MGTTKTGRHDAGVISLAAASREVVAQAEGPFREVCLHEQRSGRTAQHRAEAPYDDVIRALSPKDAA